MVETSHINFQKSKQALQSELNSGVKGGQDISLKAARQMGSKQSEPILGFGSFKQQQPTGAAGIPVPPPVPPLKQQGGINLSKGSFKQQGGSGKQFSFFRGLQSDLTYGGLKNAARAAYDTASSAVSNVLHSGSSSTLRFDVNKKPISGPFYSVRQYQLWSKLNKGVSMSDADRDSFVRQRAALRRIGLPEQGGADASDELYGAHAKDWSLQSLRGYQRARARLSSAHDAEHATLGGRVKEWARGAREYVQPHTLTDTTPKPFIAIKPVLAAKLGDDYWRERLQVGGARAARLDSAKFGKRGGSI